MKEKAVLENSNPGDNNHGFPKALENIHEKLEAAGLIGTTCERLANNRGYKLCFAGGEIINVFDTGTISVQGKNDAQVKEILGLERAANGAAQKSDEGRNDNRDKTNGGNIRVPSKNNGNPRMSYVMQMALQGALDATAAVEKYAEETGIHDRNGDPFRFSNSDIRAIGLSMFIEARRRAW